MVSWGCEMSTSATRDEPVGATATEFAPALDEDEDTSRFRTAPGAFTPLTLLERLGFFVICVGGAVVWRGGATGPSIISSSSLLALSSSSSSLARAVTSGFLIDLGGSTRVTVLGGCEEEEHDGCFESCLSWSISTAVLAFALIPRSCAQYVVSRVPDEDYSMLGSRSPCRAPGPGRGSCVRVRGSASGAGRFVY